MKKITGTIIVMFILLVINFSCISGKKTLLTEKFIPENSLAYLHVGNMEQFLKNIDAFFEPMGGIPVFGKISIKSLLKMTVESQTGLSLDILDFEKPWGGALIPGSVKVKDVGFVFCIPIKEPSKNFENIKQLVMQKLPWDIRLFGEYVILHSTKLSDKDFIPEKTLDMAGMTDYEAGSLSIYINISNIYTAFGVTPDIIKSLITANPEFSKAIIDPGQKEMTMGLFFKFIDAVTQINKVIINTRLNSEGLVYKTGFGLVSGGSLEKLSEKLALNNGIKDYAKYIPSKHLFSLAYNLDKKFILDLTDITYNLILKALEMKEEDKITIISAVKEIIAASGSKTVMGMDMDFNLNGLTTNLNDFSKSDPYDIEDVSRMLNSIYENMKIDLVAVSEIKKAEEFRASIKQMIENPAIRDLLDSFFNKIGISFSMSYTKDLKEGDFSYDEMGYKIDISELPESPDNEALQSRQVIIESLKALEDFINKYKVYIAFGKNKYYMLTGDSGIPCLKDMIAKDEFPGDKITETSVYKRFGSLIPGDAHMFGHFSISRIASMLKDIKEISNILDGMPQEPGILWYVRYAEGRWETVTMWDINEIAFLFNKIITILPGLMGKGF